jgi:hypothetical protein
MTATSVNCVDVISALLNVNAHENTKNKVLALATHMCSCQAKVVCDEVMTSLLPFLFNMFLLYVFSPSARRDFVKCPA